MRSPTSALTVGLLPARRVSAPDTHAKITRRPIVTDRGPLPESARPPGTSEGPLRSICSTERAPRWVLRWSARECGLTHGEAQLLPAVGDVDPDCAARAELAVEQHRGQRVVDLALDRAAQRPGAELGLVAVLGEPVDRGLGELDARCPGRAAAAGVLQQQIGDLVQLLGVEPAEDDDLVDPVEELGPEVLAQRGASPARAAAPRRPRRRRRRSPAHPRSPVMSSDPRLLVMIDHGVLEVDGAALGVGQPAVVEHLQQRVEHVRVGLLDLVEQQHRVRAPAHRLGQLSRPPRGRRSREARRPAG